MPTFNDATTTTATPLAVWQILYDPMRFPEWWSGFSTVRRGDASGGSADITVWPDGYPDFPMPQLMETRSRDHRVVVSCTVSDIVFDWRLDVAPGGTTIAVHVEIPDKEAARLAAQQEIVSSSLRRLAELAEEADLATDGLPAPG
jgi:uncharacterized protein YndB with AHSA1/START domain